MPWKEYIMACRHTRSVEIGPHHRMVRRIELENNFIAYICLNGIWIVPVWTLLWRNWNGMGGRACFYWRWRCRYWARSAGEIAWPSAHDDLVGQQFLTIRFQLLGSFDWCISKNSCNDIKNRDSVIQNSQENQPSTMGKRRGCSEWGNNEKAGAKRQRGGSQRTEGLYGWGWMLVLCWALLDEVSALHWDGLGYIPLFGPGINAVHSCPCLLRHALSLFWPYSVFPNHIPADSKVTIRLSRVRVRVSSVFLTDTREVPIEPFDPFLPPSVTQGLDR